MSYEDIENAYKSWRGNVVVFDSYRTLQQMDLIFYELFHKRLTISISSFNIGKFISCDVNNITETN